MRQRGDSGTVLRSSSARISAVLAMVGLQPALLARSIIPPKPGDKSLDEMTWTSGQTVTAIDRRQYTLDIPLALRAEPKRKVWLSGTEVLPEEASLCSFVDWTLYDADYVERHHIRYTAVCDDVECGFSTGPSSRRRLRRL